MDVVILDIQENSLCNIFKTDFMINKLSLLYKGDYARTRASDSKHLPAVILNVILVNILGLCII